MPRRSSDKPEKPTTAPPQPTVDEFATWQAAAVAILRLTHGVVPGTIPPHVWRRAYVRGLTLEAAAKEAAVSAYNVRPAADRMHRR
jgi:hypothetical protein